MKISEPLKKLFGHHVDKAKQHFQIGADFIRATNQSPLQPLLLRGHLGLQWGDLIKKEQFPLFTHQVELTPLRRWWISRKYRAQY